VTELVSTGTQVRARVVAPAVYDVTVTHARRSPIRHSFRYGDRTWLVDLDDIPCAPRGFRWLARFEARDHLDRLSLRGDVDRLLAAHGLVAHRVLMLAHARALGHVFWCLSYSGELVATVAEVHNTYGGRHAYLLRPDENAVGKELYVSPFHPVAGRYTLRLEVPGDELRLDVTYHRDGSEPFVATVRGTRSTSAPSLLREVLRHPLTTRLLSLRIRVQGIRLWLRRLPVVPRTHEEHP
jgi:DUF1365 family protein